MGPTLEEQSWVERNIAQVKCLSLAHIPWFPYCRHSQNTASGWKQPTLSALPSSPHKWELELELLLRFVRNQHFKHSASFFFFNLTFQDLSGSVSQHCAGSV